MSSALILVTQEQVANPDTIAKLQAQFKQYDVHQQLLERIIENAVILQTGKYCRIHLAGGALTSEVADRLYIALEDNGELTGELGSDSKVPLLIAGFTNINDSTWTKKSTASAVSAPLKRQPAAKAKKSSLPLFKRATSVTPSAEPVTPPGNDDDDDDIINEDDLIDGDMVSSAFKYPVKCDPGPGKKRRRACKDCTCGLKESEEVEQQDRDDTVLQLNTDDLAEVDFTVPGKAVGGCGSCALGDAFRCDGCPYLGLPAFKPGEVVSIDQFGDDF